MMKYNDNNERLALNNWREALIWCIDRGNNMIEYSTLNGSLWDKYYKNKSNSNIITINHMKFSGYGYFFHRINDESMLCVTDNSEKTHILNCRSLSYFGFSDEIKNQIDNGFTKYSQLFSDDKQNAMIGLNEQDFEFALKSCHPIDNMFVFCKYTSRLDITSLVKHLVDIYGSEDV